MKIDPGSNYVLAEAVAATTYSAGAENGAPVDHAKAPACSFFLSVGAVGASGTVDMKLQHSPDGTVWTDDDGASGNDIAITQITAAGTAQLNCPNPQARYSRVVVTVAVADCDLAVTSVLGPLRHVEPV